MSAIVRVFNRLLAPLCLLLIATLAASAGAAGGGWVIEREDRGDSPLLKDRKAIAQSPEARERQVLAAAYTRALQEEQAKIREHWPEPEVTSPTRWVVYADDYQVKRVVDFEHNQVEVSMDGMHQGGRLDFAAMSQAVSRHLQQTLGTSIQDALNQDPLQQALAAAHTELNPAAVDAGPSQALVLSELFDTRKPSQRQLRQVTAQLMRKAAIRYQAVNASIAVPVNTGRKLTYVVPLPDHRLRRKVQEYQPEVKRNAERFALSADVMLAIIHTESHFNPLARSHIPAFGLMQIVPSTAGRDATRKLFNKASLLSPKYLYDPGKNIEVGAAYLSVLYYDYLKDIKNPESRLYYTLAAYNAGASSVARAFVARPSFTDAVAVINRMTPQQVLERLIKQAPQRETRQYVQKVLKRRAHYANL